jgi:hypothetical protein
MCKNRANNNISILSIFKYFSKKIGAINITTINSKFLFPSPKKIAGAIDKDNIINIKSFSFVLYIKTLELIN